MKAGRCLILLGTLSIVLPSRAAEIAFTRPSDDRWHYPFNFTPGARAVAGVFGSVGTPDFPEFNDRDGIFLIAWETAPRIPAGMPPESYRVCAAQVVVTNTPGASWPIDLTTDEWFTVGQGGGTGDVDPGRPLELFGVGFGPEFSYTNWHEDSEYVGAYCDFSGTQCENLARDPFPFVFRDDLGQRLHVEDSIKGRHNAGLSPPLCPSPQGICPFTALAWAIGQPINYRPGQQATSFDVAFDVELGLSQERVRGYFQQQLAGGRVFVAITSLWLADLQGAQSNYPNFYTKEATGPGVRAPRLVLQIGSQPPGDLDGDGEVFLDELALGVDCLAGPATIPDPPTGGTPQACQCAFDADGDDDVDLKDVQRWMLDFGT